MKKFSILGFLLLLALFVTACSGGSGAQGTPGVLGTPGAGPIGTDIVATEVPNNPTFAPTTAAVATSAPVATEVPTLANPTVPAAVITNGTPASTSAAGTGVPATGTNANDQYQLCSWSGYNLVDGNNNDLGDSNDFVINAQSGQVEYVVVGAGGFLGLGEKNLLVPWSQFSMDPNKGKTLVFKGNSDMLKNAPAFDADNVDFAAPDWNKNFTTYWAGNGTVVAAPTGAAPTAAAANPTVAPTERPVIENANFVLASNLCGAWVVNNATYGKPGVNATSAAPVAGTPDATVMNNPGSNELTEDQTVGAVQTVLVDPKTARVTYLVIDTKDKLGLNGKWVPIPLPSAKIIFNNTTTDKANDLLVMIPVEQLAKAPNYSKDNLPDFSSPDWDAKLRSFWGVAQ